MLDSTEVEIRTTSGEAITVALTPDPERTHSCLIIDGVRYHFERVQKSDLVAQYTVDDDPDYAPRSDAAGYCYVLAPYSE